MRLSPTSIDEVGYLPFSNPCADLLFELVSRRYQHKSTVLTNNRAFVDWGEVFRNAACVVSLIDRLMHRAEVVRIAGESYRDKQADEREAQRQADRNAARIDDLGPGLLGATRARGHSTGPLPTRAGAGRVRVAAVAAPGPVEGLQSTGAAGLARSTRTRRVATRIRS